ncbi:uncharacterized protein TrAFT101_010982 [Trichoderma asperellum]|uniref:uncharacterized protein n=1 Tax=Trichoderma asperellum TaxID=101201 RepID=UPI0033317019|nr:hypothetical protein TrAFT101_010982 [Trichoderma asperellum]
MPGAAADAADAGADAEAAPAPAPAPAPVEGRGIVDSHSSNTSNSNDESPDADGSSSTGTTIREAPASEPVPVQAIAQGQAQAPAPAQEASVPASAPAAAPLSPLSTSSTATSPASPTFLSVAGRVSTPLSLFVDSAPSSGGKQGKKLPTTSSPTSPSSESAAAIRQRYLAMSSPTAASAIAPRAAGQESRLSIAGTAAAEATERMRRGLRVDEAETEAEVGEEEEEEVDEAGWKEKSTGTGTAGPPLPWSPSANHGGSSSYSNNASSSSSAAAAAAAPVSLNRSSNNKHDTSRGIISAPLPQSPDDARATPGRHERPSNYGRDSDIASAAISTTVWSPASASSSSQPGLLRRSPAEDPPLHTGSVQPGTKLAHPKPILHIATDAEARNHHHSDLLTRSASTISNVAHLEATAERLSMTSSIDDAIRELHGELKRSDSRRSSILAARAASADEHSASSRLRRYPSNASSSAAAAARQKGYSPAAARRMIEQDAVGGPHMDDFQEMLEGGFRSHRASNLVLVNPDLPPDHYDEADRPMTANSTNTFQVAQEAFDDFDGAHCETDTEDERFATADMGSRLQKRERLPDMPLHHQQQQEQYQLQQQYQAPPPGQLPPHPPVAQEDTSQLRTPQQRSSGEFVRPQSYFDPQSGQQMLYYPARVPAMLNLPPKLSNKPKAADRNQRRSQLLSAMMQPKENKRKSIVPDLEQIALPDPLSGHRNSFAALSVADKLDDGDDDTATTPTPYFVEGSVPQSRDVSAPPSLEDLRRPQRLSKNDADKRKSNMDKLGTLPPHLRASVFFEQPSEIPEIEVKDGSAMATLDSILDASATAPVSAFTDHLYAGKLGNEVYGQEKKKENKKKAAAAKHKSQQLSTNTLGDASSKGSTIRLLTKRSKSSLLGIEANESEAGPSGAHDDSHDGADEEDEEEARREEEEPEEGIFEGMPTTLLGEIHLRKQRQKERVLNQGNMVPQRMRATLLEMDAVAEMQRKQRLKGRVNLAWEDQNVPAEQHLSDDEDVPLAVIAAMHDGAKNVLDLERPIGLMEAREMEENEPLSQRAARLQGRASAAFTAAKRQSNLSLGPTRMAEVQPAAGSPRIITPDGAIDDDARTTITATAASASAEPLAEEIEEETLGARKRRLAESTLPRARPVSNAFSAELLSQFGDLEEPKDKEGDKSPNPEDETLGQRRRRLQAEREARAREMSYGNLTGERLAAYGNLTGEQANRLSRRVSMADMLSVHQLAEDPRIADQRRQQEEQMRIAEQNARMAAMRAQMPTALALPGNARAGGFKGGLYNDGTGGLGIEAASRSTVALNTLHSRSFTNTGPRNHRATMMMPPQTAYGMQQSYSTLTGFHGAGMNQMANNPMYSNARNLYNSNGVIQLGTGMALPNGSLDRVERWRQGVFP